MAKVSALDADHLKKLIREIPDFPKKGILFYDITTLLKDKTGFATLIDKLSEQHIPREGFFENVKSEIPLLEDFVSGHNLHALEEVTEAIRAGTS